MRHGFASASRPRITKHRAAEPAKLHRPVREERWTRIRSAAATDSESGRTTHPAHGEGRRNTLLPPGVGNKFGPPHCQSPRFSAAEALRNARPDALLSRLLPDRLLLKRARELRVELPTSFLTETFENGKCTLTRKKAGSIGGRYEYGCC